MDTVQLPIAFLSPVIDGQVTTFFEWRGAGTINPNPPLGAMWKAEGIFAAILFGFDRDHLYVRLDPDQRAASRRTLLTIDLLITLKERQDKFSFALDPSEAERVVLSSSTPSGEYQERLFSGNMARRTIIELAIPFNDLQIDFGQDLRLSLLVLEKQLEVARYPHHNPVMFSRPGDDFEAAMWRV